LLGLDSTIIAIYSSFAVIILTTLHKTMLLLFERTLI